MADADPDSDSGSSTPTNSNGWNLFTTLEENNPAEWLLNFDNTNTGIKNIDTTGFEPIDFFRIFFPMQAIDLMVTETNRFGDQFVQTSQLKDKSRKKEWFHLENVEIEAFIGLQIAMGLNVKPAEKDHWQVMFWLTYTHYKLVLSWNRYQLKESFLHFCPRRIPRGTLGHNPLFRIQPLLDIIFS